MVRKNIVITGAIRSRLAFRIQNWARNTDSTSPIRGSCCWPNARPMNRGVTPSRDNACKVRGAATRLARAEDNVAAHNPAKISGGNTERSCITSLFSTRSPRSAFIANQVICATYTRNVTPTAHKVPRGMLRDGSFRSPDMLTPAMMPVTAGK